MKNLPFALLFLFFILPSCKDGDTFNPRDASNIEGVWQGTAGGNAVWTLYFSDGYSQHRVIDFGQELLKYEYAYRTHRDTIFMDNLFNNQLVWNRVWVVEFKDRDNVVAREVGQPDTLPRFVLKRIP